MWSYLDGLESVDIHTKNIQIQCSFFFFLCGVWEDGPLLPVVYCIDDIFTPMIDSIVLCLLLDYTFILIFSLL